MIDPTTVKREHFEALAPRWDAIKPQDSSAATIARGLDLVEPLAGRVVVDLGCGTGILASHLLPRIGAGRVLAVDFAAGMVERARARWSDPRLDWLCADVLETGLAAASVDVVLCFDAFPHFARPAEALHEVARWLRPGGAFLLWHDVGRELLASIHGQAGPPLDADLLPPVVSLAASCETAGLAVAVAEEDAASYTLLARRT